MEDHGYCLVGHRFLRAENVRTTVSSCNKQLLHQATLEAKMSMSSNLSSRTSWFIYILSNALVMSIYLSIALGMTSVIGINDVSVEINFLFPFCVVKIAFFDAKLSSKRHFARHSQHFTKTPMYNAQEISAGPQSHWYRIYNRYQNLSFPSFSPNSHGSHILITSLDC